MFEFVWKLIFQIFSVYNPPLSPMASVGAVTSRLVRLPPDQQASKFIFVVGSTCATRCNFLGEQLKMFRSTASNTGSKYIPKQILMLKKSVYPSFIFAIWAYSRGIEYMNNEYNKRISYGSTIAVTSMCILFIFIACFFPLSLKFCSQEEHLRYTVN